MEMNQTTELCGEGMTVTATGCGTVTTVTVRPLSTHSAHRALSPNVNVADFSTIRAFFQTKQLVPSVQDEVDKLTHLVDARWVSHKQTNKQTNKQQANKQASKQTNKHTNKHTNQAFPFIPIPRAHRPMHRRHLGLVRHTSDRSSVSWSFCFVAQ
jgi:hypothetical protein